jgi:hypothetical protein
MPRRRDCAGKAISTRFLARFLARLLPVPTFLRISGIKVEASFVGVQHGQSVFRQCRRCLCSAAFAPSSGRGELMAEVRRRLSQRLVHWRQEPPPTAAKSQVFQETDKHSTHTVCRLHNLDSVNTFQHRIRQTPIYRRLGCADNAQSAIKHSPTVSVGKIKIAFVQIALHNPIATPSRATILCVSVSSDG